MKKIYFFISATAVFAASFFGANTAFGDDILKLVSENSNSVCRGKIKSLEACGVLKSFANAYSKASGLGEFDAEIMWLGRSDAPAISAILVSKKALCFVEARFSCDANKPVSKIAFKDGAGSDFIDKINSVYKNCEGGYCNVSEPDLPIIILSSKSKVEMIFSVSPILESEIKVEKDALNLRGEILENLGLDTIGADLSNITSFSLKEKLREKSVSVYKDVYKLEKLYLRGNRLLYPNLWQYYSNSESGGGQYMATWLYFIENELNSNNRLDVAPLFSENFKSILANIYKKEGLLPVYIQYRHALYLKDAPRAEELAKKLKSEKISPSLIEPLN